MEAMTIKQFKGNIVEVKTKNGVRLYYYDDCLAYLSNGVKYKDIKDKAKKFDFGSVRC